MNNHRWAVATTVVRFVGLFWLGTFVATAQVTDPVRPSGKVSASPTLVRAGTYPTLNWGIVHPQIVTQLAARDPDGTLVPTDNSYMDVRVLGVSNQATDGTLLPVEICVRTNNATPYTRIFLNVASQVDPSQVVLSDLVQTGKPIDFQARDFNGSTWDSYRSTETLTCNVMALIDGELPPSTNSSFRQNNVQSFLKPYLDSNGRILIGPMDVIYLFELNTSSTNSPSFNLQDVVILVTLRGKNNNGHGNNLDGVDISNPGQGGGGPNGGVDTSAPVDDERPR